LSSIVRGAGVRFFVVTGDHPATSVAIAAQAGIITNVDSVHTFDDLKTDGSVVNEKEIFSDEEHDVRLRSIVVTGPQLDLLTPAQEDLLYRYQEIVFARTTPEQKLRIVRSLQARDGVVAMTGDGVNDAPSLRAADCGIAMGNGSDVAREAADMVLLEDFSAIVIALEYGQFLPCYGSCLAQLGLQVVSSLKISRRQFSTCSLPVPSLNSCQYYLTWVFLSTNMIKSLKRSFRSY
jgi:sodium/potassium-transporting ATPase subunit alpha